MRSTKHMFERLLSVIVALAGVTAAASLAHREFSSAPKATFEPQPPKAVNNWSSILKGGRWIGERTAPVVIVEFADLECPFCKRFDSTFQSLQSRFGDQVALVFHHYPLERVHRFAVPAAKAAECAAEQGKFGEFVRSVYEKQDSLGLKSWASFAQESGVPDTAAIQLCATATRKFPRIANGVALGDKVGVHATPTILINGLLFSTPPNDSMMTAIILKTLGSKSATTQ